jgi:DNA sulfur modification protein DndD
MLLKSIKLKNFRQFINENEIEFSLNENKNVSIILGENGSGKTSLAQAFTWCLYGITDFKDSSMLNKVVETKMLPGDEEEVRVDIELIHDDTEFNISRIQTYKKKNNGQTFSLPTSFHVAKKIRGQQEFIKNPELEVKQILPKELAGYFFLNGEHIEKLNKELNRGKSQEFATAVENLLGLKAFLEAIDHFSPSKKHSVIGNYNEQYDGDSNKEILALRDEIQTIQEDISRKKERYSKIMGEIEIGVESCAKLEDNIRENKESEKHQLRIDTLNKDINYKKKLIEEETALLLTNFNNFGLSFLSKSLITDSLNFLASEEVVDKGIPEIHERTINFLIKRGYCICGTKIKEGENPHKHLIETLEFIPPKSIGTVLSDFLLECGNAVHISDTYFDNFENQYSHIRMYENEIDEHISEIESLTNLLKGMKDVGVYQSKLSIEKERLDKLREDANDLIKNIGVLEDNLGRKENSLRELALKDKNNARIEIYKAYSQEIYNKLTKYYELEESKVREMLEKAINQIFKKIYEGGMSISVDEKYRIKVTVDEVKGFTSEIETSTAQSTSVIFAFIAGIIKLAKDFSSDKNIDHELLASSEPYPLLMDAPLSNFDKRRIRTVCETLPKVAEQVIVFIKDTDGDIAEEHLGAIIGKRYQLKKENEVETYIVER